MHFSLQHIRCNNLQLRRDGSFDYTKGGFPSATFAHSNVAIVPKETWYSFTQYAAGGLF
jgi:hypothetical protein